MTFHVTSDIIIIIQWSNCIAMQPWPLSPGAFKVTSKVWEWSMGPLEVALGGLPLGARRSIFRELHSVTGVPGEWLIKVSNSSASVKRNLADETTLWNDKYLTVKIWTPIWLEGACDVDSTCFGVIRLETLLWSSHRCQMSRILRKHYQLFLAPPPAFLCPPPLHTQL